MTIQQGAREMTDHLVSLMPTSGHCGTSAAGRMICALGGGGAVSGQVGVLRMDNNRPTVTAAQKKGVIAVSQLWGGTCRGCGCGGVIVRILKILFAAIVATTTAPAGEGSRSGAAFTVRG